MTIAGDRSSDESQGSFRLSFFETHHRCPRTGRLVRYLTEVLTGPRVAWPERPESRDPEWVIAAPSEIEAIGADHIAAIRWTGPVEEFVDTALAETSEEASILSPGSAASV